LLLSPNHAGSLLRVDSRSESTISGTMFDPALIHSLQQAMAPPSIMPPAIERAWMSPAADRGDRVVGPWLIEAEERGRAWRTRLLETEPDLEIITSLVWDVGQLTLLDDAIVTGASNSDKVERWADEQRRSGMRANKIIARQDASAAAVQKRHVERFSAMHRENVAALRRFVTKLRAYRNFVDPRTGAEPGYVPKPWTPNTVTATAMREAIDGVGMRRVGSMAELIAELHAEGD